MNSLRRLTVNGGVSEYPKIALPPVKGTHLAREELLSITATPTFKQWLGVIAILTLALVSILGVGALNAAEDVYQAGRV